MSSDAQRDILKMLSENVISVDEAERLLKALNAGEQRKEDPHSRRRRHHHSMGMGSVFESIGDALSDIGPVIKNTMEDVMTGVFGDDLGDLDDEDFVDVEPVEEQYEISEDTQMVIVSDWKWGPKRGDLRVQGVPGNACRIENEEAQHMRIRRSATHFVIQWSGGPLKVEVPETVTKVRVRSKGGDIHVAGVQCDMSVKTLGGDLDLKDLLKDFKIKTMGGDISLVMASGWQGTGKVHTMGGDVTLRVPEGVAFGADASTMGGTISADKDMRQVESKQSFPGKSSAKIHVGVDETTSTLNLKTMGGDITLRKDTHEEHEHEEHE
jgi:DUF4097 and DUF4098 domain-containing protein YvlB